VFPATPLEKCVEPEFNGSVESGVHPGEEAMSDSLERKASTLNGLIIVGACALGVFEATRFWGISIAAFMGAGLIFSGWANFCGWYRILSPRGSKQTSHASFWIGGRDAYIKGVNDHYSVQINDATNRANESVSEAERKQHFDRAKALRAEHRQMIDEAKHAVY
jgi:hypothetical protein